VGKNPQFWHGMSGILDIEVSVFWVVVIGPNHEFFKNFNFNPSLIFDQPKMINFLTPITILTIGNEVKSDNY
jgi:hypothetical protein